MHICSENFCMHQPHKPLDAEQNVFGGPREALHRWCGTTTIGVRPA